MDKRILLLLLVASLLCGCTITGRSAGILQNEAMQCSFGTRIDFLRIGEDAQACYRENGIYLVVENIGSIPISGINVQLVADYNISMNIKVAASAGQSIQQSLSLGAQSLSGVKELRVYPIIAGSAELCKEALITTELEQC